jgi:hypothetical protein
VSFIIVRVNVDGESKMTKFFILLYKNTKIATSTQ